MSKAAELAALIGSQTALSNKNLIINGAMQVAQRGTSETSVTTSGYRNACDRFRCNGNNGTWTISQDTNAPDGFSNSFKMLLTATESIGGTSYWAVEQRIEGQNLQSLAYGTSSAKTVTLSFYVKSNITGTYTVNLYQDDGGKNFPKTYTIDSADTWERKTISFAGDTSTPLDNDNASSLRPIFLVVAGSSYNSGTPGSRGTYTDATFAAGHTAQIDAVNDYFQITGVQLEVGEQATPFEHRSIGDELARCKRYFQRHDNDNSAYRWFGSGYTTSTTAASIGVALNPPMRAIPSFSLNVGASNFIFDQSGGAKACSAITSSFSSNTMARLFLTIGTTTASTPGWLASDGTSSLRALDFDAEL